MKDRLGSREKRFSINFSEARIKFCLSLHYNDDNSYLFVKGKVIFKVKIDNVNFLTQFCLGSISNGLGTIDSREVSLKENVYDFSVNYSAIDKSEILNIH